MNTGITETLFKNEEGFAVAPLHRPALSADGQVVVYEHTEEIGQTKICGQYWVPVYGPVIYRATPGNSASRIEVTRSFYEENILRSPEANCQMGYYFHNITSRPTLADLEGSVLVDYRHTSGTQYGGSNGDGALIKPVQGDRFELFDISLSYSAGFDEQNGDEPVRRASLSADGQIFAFGAGDLRNRAIGGDHINASPEFSDDVNQYMDIYWFNCTTNRYQRITDTAEGVRGNGNSLSPFVAGNGQTIVFVSDATNLTDGDTNGVRDILLWEGTR